MHLHFGVRHSWAHTLFLPRYAPALFGNVQERVCCSTIVDITGCKNLPLKIQEDPCMAEQGLDILLDDIAETKTISNHVQSVN